MGLLNKHIVYTRLKPKESIVSRFLPFVEENLLYPPAQQSGLKKIIARRDANECTMEEDINAIPTFTFFEVDDYGGLMMSPSLIYSAITLLSSFDQFSILSKRSNAEEYNLLETCIAIDSGKGANLDLLMNIQHLAQNQSLLCP